METALSFPPAAPVNADDAWGSPAPPADSSPSGDPFGDSSKKDDPWGSLSSAANDETGTFGFAPTPTNLFPSSNADLLPFDPNRKHLLEQKGTSVS